MCNTCHAETWWHNHRNSWWCNRAVSGMDCTWGTGREGCRFVEADTKMLWELSRISGRELLHIFCKDHPDLSYKEITVILLKGNEIHLSYRYLCYLKTQHNAKYKQNILKILFYYLACCALFVQILFMQTQTSVVSENITMPKFKH